MAVQTRNQLKSWFETGDRPTQDQFWDWIDSFWHLTEDASLLSSYVTNASLSSTLSTYIQSSDVVDNLLSSSSVVPLSANQGRVLKGLIDGISVNTTWGSITGILSSQSDLNSALNSKQDSLTSLNGLTLNFGNQLNLGGSFSSSVILQSTNHAPFEAYSETADSITQESLLFAKNGAYQFAYLYSDASTDSGFYYNALNNRFTTSLGDGTYQAITYEELDGITVDGNFPSYFGIKYARNNSSNWGVIDVNNRYIPDIGFLVSYVQSNLGTSTFIGLTDTPATYTANKWIKVNAGGTALEFVDAPASSGVWGSITGTLSSQTDLQSALDAKEDVLTFGNGLTRSGDSISLGDATVDANISLVSSAGNTINLQSGDGSTYTNNISLLSGSLSIGSDQFGGGWSHKILVDRTNDRIDIVNDDGVNDSRLRFEDGDIVITDGGVRLVNGLKYVRDSESNWGTINSSNLYVPHVGWVVDYVASASGTSTLNDLTDVTIVAPALGQYLYYNGSNWANKQIAYSEISGTPSIPTTLPSLSDVTITSAASGEYLGWNGSAWVDKQIAYSEVSGTPTLATVATTGAYSDLTGTPTVPSLINQLTDVTISSPLTSNYLGWNGSAWVNRDISYSQVSGTPTLATVATSGSYNDLSNKPSILAQSFSTWTPAKSALGPNITINTADIFSIGYMRILIFDITTSTSSDTTDFYIDGVTSLIDYKTGSSARYYFGNLLYFDTGVSNVTTDIIQLDTVIRRIYVKRDSASSVTNRTNAEMAEKRIRGEIVFWTEP